jgi:hypothetical protein
MQCIVMLRNLPQKSWIRIPPANGPVDLTHSLVGPAFVTQKNYILFKP